jgi:tRNA(fMet)-specific endonuclease VapC
MSYLLDTSTCISIINKKPSSALKRIQTKRPDQIAVSTITQAELEYGVARSSFPDRNRIALLHFLFPFRMLDFDQSAAVQYGGIRAFLESKGTPIEPVDLLIAAQAKSRDLILVTNNEKEFQRIEGLKMENWVRT